MTNSKRQKQKEWLIPLSTCRTFWRMQFAFSLTLALQDAKHQNCRKTGKPCLCANGLPTGCSQANRTCTAFKKCLQSMLHLPSTFFNDWEWLKLSFKTIDTVLLSLIHCWKWNVTFPNVQRTMESFLLQMDSCSPRCVRHKIFHFAQEAAFRRISPVRWHHSTKCQLCWLNPLLLQTIPKCYVLNITV